jgi:hypothetical protein
VAVTGRAPHDDWLLALPVTSCGLRLSNEAIRVAVGLRLGIKICEAHTCPCGQFVDVLGTQSLSCKHASGRSARHHNLNDVVARALTRAGVPVQKEPLGLIRTDGKRPDGVTDAVAEREMLDMGRDRGQLRCIVLRYVVSTATGRCGRSSSSKKGVQIFVTCTGIFVSAYCI